LTTHILAITYKPKEEAVRTGACRQTIRPVSEAPHAKPRRVGDDALLHGWKGVPYYSKWSWRRRDPLTTVNPIRVSDAGIGKHFPGNSRSEWIQGWDTSYADALASLDFISPPTGIALRDVLRHYHDFPLDMEVLRW
jgi:hypothetical protein